VTAAGSEVIEGYDGYNDNYSRSILFGYAIPFTHTGVKATYGWSDKLATSVMLANGWDVARDNNDGKTVGVSVVLTPASTFTGYINYIGGPERTGSDDLRHLIDLVAVFKLRPDLTFTFNYDHAVEEGGAGDSEDAAWDGAAAYLRHDFTPRFAITGRAEVFNDEDGVRTGTAQRVSELTITPSWKLTDRFVFRADLRADRSDEAVFEDGEKQQVTTGFNVLYSF